MALLLAYITLNSIFAASICRAVFVFNWSLFLKPISKQVNFPAISLFPKLSLSGAGFLILTLFGGTSKKNYLANVMLILHRKASLREMLDTRYLILDAQSPSLRARRSNLKIRRFEHLILIF